ALREHQGHRLPPRRRRLRRRQGRVLRGLQELPQDPVPGEGPLRGACCRRPRQPRAGRADGRGRLRAPQRQPAAVAGRRRGLTMAAAGGRDRGAAAASDIPSLDRLLRDPALAALLGEYGQARVTGALRARLDDLRQAALAGELQHDALQPEALAGDASVTLHLASQPRLRTVFNLTGTVLHTNLGRALLPDEAVQSVVRALTAPVALEFDLERGARGDRDALVEDLLCELTGAEAATVVNNNAAAVLLMLNSLANRREVIVSRGELVEIGGAFRIPDIMKRAGAKLVEVGTTNRTHPHDYEDSIGARTAMLLKVHCSNYAISGFTSSVDTPALSAIARAHGLPLGVDLGRGSLIDPP